MNAPPKFSNFLCPCVTEITHELFFWESYENPREFSKLLPSFSPQSLRFFENTLILKPKISFSKILKIWEREWEFSRMRSRLASLLQSMCRILMKLKNQFCSNERWCHRGADSHSWNISYIVAQFRSHVTVKPLSWNLFRLKRFHSHLTSMNLKSYSNKLLKFIYHLYLLISLGLFHLQW